MLNFRQMTAFRPILIGIYLITMVLMPHLHLVAGGHNEPLAAAHHCCSEPDHDREEPNEPADRSSHENCQLCRALNLFANVPIPLPVCSPIYCISEAPIEAPTLFYAIFPVPTLARAPPFSAVYPNI